MDYDPSLVPALIRANEESVAALKQAIVSKSGAALVDFILEDIQELKRLLTDSRSFAALISGMNAAVWLNEQMAEWLGEKSVADLLSQSLPDNVTSAMGLALLDVADAMRPHPAVVELLQQAQDDSFLDELTALEGGQEARAALLAFLDQYGMRCVGEIDITRPRWREHPVTLLPLLLNNIRNAEPGESRRRFAQGERAAQDKAEALLTRLKQLPDGEQKADEAQRMVRVLRGYGGYREYPKYGMMQRYFVYKQALRREGERLVQAGLMQDPADIDYLTLDELGAVVTSLQLDPHIIAARKEAHRRNERLAPPRVITSDGEIIEGAYRREKLPPGALVGLPVSSGVVEGRARVILHLEDASLEAGDILVTPYTDPSWTPLFVAIRGLVTEVGGLMTHGAVIAREYGLPAVVGVVDATRRIADGQRIRVHGGEGYVEML